MKKERKDAISLIRRTALQSRCPFELQYGRCNNVAVCPYLHRNKECKTKEDYNDGDQVEAVVSKWVADKGFGFARAKGGVEFFIHKDELKFEDSILLQGSMIAFIVKKHYDKSKKDRATDVTLK